MLDKKVFVSELNRLLRVFPFWNIDFNDKETLKVWYDIFKKHSDDSFKKMVDNYLLNEERTPTVAGLRKWDTTPRKSVTQLQHEQALKEHGYD